MVIDLALAHRRELVHRAHVYEQHEHCTVEHCIVCDGGLALCKTCGALEGALLDNCPGVRLTAAQHEWNHAANMRRWRKEAAHHYA